MACGTLLPLSSIPFAELVGLWLGLKAVMSSFHLQQIWIEGDTWTAILWVTSPHHSKSASQPLFKDILAWKAVILVCHVTRVSRG